MTHRRSRLRTAAALASTLAVAASLTALLTAAGTPAPAAVRRPPDLAVTSVGGPAVGTIGQRITVSTRVVNRGTMGARRSSYRFALSRDARVGDDVTLTPLFLLDGFRGGASDSYRERVVVPERVTPGRYRLIGCVIPSGRDAARANNCRIGPAIRLEEAPWVGRLSGTLVFQKSFDEVVGSTERHSHDRQEIEFDIDVDESREGWLGFVSNGGSYTYDGSSHEVSEASNCRVVRDGKRLGNGKIVQNWDPYYDLLYGQFARTDHSEITLVTQLPNQVEYTTTKTPLGELGCRGGVTSESWPGRSLDDLELTEIRRTPDEVWYEVTDAHHSGQQDTTWQSITGRLVFTHAG